MEKIIINQLGYRLEDYKVAIIEGCTGKFEIVNLANNQIVWTGETGPLVKDKVSGASLSRLDFTSFQQQGDFIIKGIHDQSLPFKIGVQNYNDLHKALIKAFYFFRCGVVLEEQYAQHWGHAACHTSPAIVYDNPSKRIDGNGGWHDAGDFGKYIVAAGKAVADLLLAYEFYPQKFKNKIPLSETNHNLDDLLHEVKVEVNWMLKMQDKESGGVYHKLTTLQFPPLNTMPEDDTNDLYVMPISATATASFAATLAMVARVYKPFDEGFSEQCLAAAEQAWHWLNANPSVPGFKNPSNVFTGEYGDDSDADERYWAAAELYRTTGKIEFHNYFKQYAKDVSINKSAFGWANMGGYGTISYLLCEQETDSPLREELLDILIQRSQDIVNISEKDGFGNSLLEEQYQWGSNMEVLNNAMLLLMVQKLGNHKKYKNTISIHLHYILGLNINRYSYISGFGARAIKHHHHRPSVADQIEEPIPGLVSGGPNKNLQDECVVEHCSNQPAAACFIDHEESYSTNEVTIYWNSPAVFVLSEFIS